MRIIAAVAAAALILACPGPFCWEAVAAELKAAPVELRPGAAPIAPVQLPQLQAGLSPAVIVVPQVSIPSIPELPSATQPVVAKPWSQRFSELGARFTEIAGIKGAGERLQAFSGFFDLSGLRAQPAFAVAVGGDYRPPAAMLMSSARRESSGSGRSTPPAPKSAVDLARDNTDKADRRLLRASVINAAAGVLAGLAAFAAGARPASVLILGLLPSLTAMLSDGLRTGAARSLRAGSFQTLFAGEKAAGRAALIARLGALTTMDLGGMLALKLLPAHPVAAAVLAGAVLAGWAAWRLAKTFSQAAYIERAGAYGVLKEGEPQTPLDHLPGASALERHGRYFSGGKEVAKFWTTFHYVRMQGLSPWGAFTTAASWHLFFSGKTQKNMTPGEKAKFKPGRFDNYIPNFADAQGPTNTRIYAMRDIPGVAKKGDVDMREFERLFRDFAPGRDYLTMKDLGRIWRANAERDRAKGLKKAVGKLAFNKRFKQLLTILADRVVEEDGRLVPAISRAGLLRYYQGGAPYDLLRERGGR